jgi:hypothetical protein
MNDHFEQKGTPNNPTQLNVFIPGIEFTDERKDAIYYFMHEDFNSLKIGGGRLPEMIVEYPPEYVANPVDWANAVNMVLIPELDELSPMFRKRPTRIRFLNDNSVNQNKHEAGAAGIVMDNENFIFVNLAKPDENNLNISTAFYYIVHEISELDFKLKSKANKSNDISKEQRDATFHRKDGSYHQLINEKIANRRALRAIKRLWPNTRFTDESNLYEEDR